MTQHRAMFLTVVDFGGFAFRWQIEDALASISEWNSPAEAIRISWSEDALVFLVQTSLVPKVTDALWRIKERSGIAAGMRWELKPAAQDDFEEIRIVAATKSFPSLSWETRTFFGRTSVKYSVGHWVNRHIAVCAEFGFVARIVYEETRT